jgi:cyclic beta-1,2-glucan synthetase
MSINPKGYLGALPCESLLTDAILYGAGTLAVAGCAVAAYQSGGWVSVLLAGLLGLLSGELLKYKFTGYPLTFAEALQDILIPGLFAASGKAGIQIWQVPGAWGDLFILTELGSALACVIYLSALLYGLSANREHMKSLAGGAFLLVPYLFNGLLLLDAPWLLERIGRAAIPFIQVQAGISHVLGKIVVLGLFNEAVASGISVLIARRWICEGRVHVLLLGSAAAASLSPVIATWGSGGTVARLPGIIGIPATLGATMLSQAGLWSQTFLITGMFMDAFHARKPTGYWCTEHYCSGAAKGAVYSLVFMSIVHGVAIVIAIKGAASYIASHFFLASLIGCAAVFPLLKTIVETFDGSERFFRRVGQNYQDPIHYLRGATLGSFAGFGLASGLPGQGSFERFVFGVAAGAVGYAGVDFLWDALEMTRGKRLRFQSWRVYALAAALGGGVGGALAWYFDVAQIAVIEAKFLKYAILHYSDVGRPMEEYVIYPLCSKWGAMNLGNTEGGVKLLYNEALSGVINWSLAAPLFSINLMVLTALLQRRTAPLKELFTSRGVVDLVEQAVRVLRWGLWMAPIIYSFLRMSPDPTWYNQDGAIRTLVVTLKSWTLDAQGFRSFSLNLFLSMLVYDWFRILIWLDHMGLRVATLVNLSFVGADLLDEKAARAIGYSARTRCIPEGLRRFGTWAPLLIPFYLPRGAEWDYVWSRSEILSKNLTQTSWPSIVYVVGGFLIVAFLVPTVSCMRRLGPMRWRGISGRARPAPAEVPYEEKRYIIANGIYTVEVTADGRGYSRAFSAVRKGVEMDITRRPDDPLQMRGKFFYLVDRDKPDDSEESSWSIGRSPAGRLGADCRVSQPAPLSLLMTNVYGGISAEARLSLDASDPVEFWQVRLVNLEGRARRIHLISYQEFGLNNPDVYRRHPFLNTIHMETRFVRPMNAILAVNRLLKSAERDVTKRRMSRESAFHAVKEAPSDGITLLGYEDSRSDFIGKGTLREPDGLRRTRSPGDEGLIYTFDPIASLQLLVNLAPYGCADIAFLDGYGRDERCSLELIKRHLGLEMAGDPSTWAAFSRVRSLHEDRKGRKTDVDRRTGSRSFYEFSPDGTELHVDWNTSRPWGHLMANAAGYGTLVMNDGSIYSFMKNSQQNGLTPFDTDSVPSQIPGQVVYVLNLATGEMDSPTFIPFRRRDGICDVIWGRGYALFRKRRAAMEMEMKIFVLPDQPAEVRLLKIKNHGTEPLNCRVVPYAQIMLGGAPVDSAGKISVHWDHRLTALFFTNPHNDFHRGWAFVATSLPVETFETVRRKFLGGQDRDLVRPFMVEHGVPDSGQPDDGYRIASFVGTVTVQPGGESAVSMVFGQTETMEQGARIITALKDVASNEHAFERTKKWWSDFLSVLQCETNDPAFDRMVNGWLAYQTLVARIWGRFGPYQRSGGYGYRDQLQDVLPFLYLHPNVARSQILLHAAQQFREGDVLQWWHETWEGKTGIGLRGRASDPHLWLPYVVGHYVKATGDGSILDQDIPFLEGKPLSKRSEGRVLALRPSRDSGSLYVHCLRALDLSLKRTGPNGLPLLGMGDWNDSLDRVGFKGRGESVWLGFFLYDILITFVDLVATKEGEERRDYYKQKALRLRKALEAMWRGDRFVRAITDEGNEITRVNALVSGWAILSGATDFARGCLAMETALRALEKEKVVLLFTPPYAENYATYPGRLAEYPPGVRENGGQYSHGVSWLVDALLILSESAAKKGFVEMARHYRLKAVELWRKISPLSHLEADEMIIYGLPPHQQAADVYYGPGYEGRGGWSWYTGAAARMLYTAYHLLGLKMENGELVEPQDLYDPRGSLTLKRLLHKPSLKTGPI